LNKLRIAHIGAGGFATHFIFPQLGLHPVEPVAVCDVVEQRSIDAQRRFGFARAYTDFRLMCEQEQLDAALVTVGGQGHYEIARELLCRRIPTYLQKPPAATGEQTRELIYLAEETGTVCHVGFNLRYSVALRRAREIIASNEFGVLTLLVYRYGLVSGRTWRDAVIEQHCHAFDSVIYLAGKVNVVEVALGSADTAHSYAVLLKFANGAVGTINFTQGQTPSKEFIYFEATGENGHFLTCHDGNLVYRRGPAGQPDEFYTVGHYGFLPNLYWLGYVADVANFVSAVNGTEPDASPIASTLDTMSLAEEVYRRLRQEGAPE
jgi:myo-inositol 2-dehydrogenase/D-chiro-inositol 1-dehydrogenase